MNTATTMSEKLDRLATDIGRLRRSLDRMAGDLETLALMVEPTAAELAATTAPSDETALTEAIRVVDERARRLRRLLGEAA